MTPASSRWSDFRQRGGLWVVAQTILFAAIAVSADLGPRWPGDARFALSIAGGVLTGLGLGFAFWAYRSLGSAFTPDVKAAWTSAYGVLAGTMKDAAAA